MDSNLVWLHFVDMLPVIACGCVLPIVFIWLETRRKINESRERMQIVTTAIEKHPDMDVEELMNKISPKKKSLKEKLLSKLLWGCIAAIMGVGLLALGICIKTQDDYCSNDEFIVPICFGVILLGIGAAFIINYSVGKKMLAKEMEAEEKNKTTQSNQ
jgi:hypothetical protein